MAELKSLRVERTDHVAEVTLLGPGKGNAMGPDFWHELPIVFEELTEDSEVRAIVLTGSGRHFSYGLDLPAMLPTWGEVLGTGAMAGPRTEFLHEIRRLQAAITSVAACRMPNRDPASELATMSPMSTNPPTEVSTPRVMPSSCFTGTAR